MGPFDPTQHRTPQQSSADQGLMREEVSHWLEAGEGQH